jgi:hypothetical protein
MIAAMVAAGLFGYMWLVESQRLRVRRLELGFRNLPAAFDGYIILHLSDLHISRLGRLERKVAGLIGKQPVDTCVITGDVTAQPRASDNFRRLCSAIRHSDPIFMVLGNSEHKPWLDTEMLLNALSFDGLEILNNSSTSVRRGDESIRIVGVDDPYSRLDDLDRAFEGVDPAQFVVFLTHCPSTTPDGIARGADLILAGHTHGGQVRIPFVGITWTHMRRNKRLNDGLYRPEALSRILGIDAGDSVLFVHRGVGTSRIPIRFFCPPEVVYITLRRSE